MKKIVILSGAGISAESGIRTFRDSNGLWEGHDVMEVASPQGWTANKETVLEFYNQRRKQALEVFPNAGHEALVELEKYYEVSIVTQNVDNLHERAGSSAIIHLHGEIFKSRSTLDPSLVYPIEGWELNLGDKCEKGAQLRPHIVWFGEAVPAIEEALDEVRTADIFIIVGTSLNVYPAAGLINDVRSDTKIYIVDPQIPDVLPRKNITFIEEKGTTGLQKLKKELIAQAAK